MTHAIAPIHAGLCASLQGCEQFVQRCYAAAGGLLGGTRAARKTRFSYLLRLHGGI